MLLNNNINFFQYYSHNIYIQRDNKYKNIKNVIIIIFIKLGNKKYFKYIFKHRHPAKYFTKKKSQIALKQHLLIRLSKF